MTTEPDFACTMDGEADKVLEGIFGASARPIALSYS